MIKNEVRNFSGIAIALNQVLNNPEFINLSIKMKDSKQLGDVFKNIGMSTELKKQINLRFGTALQPVEETKLKPLDPQLRMFEAW
jgi:hypothetical protein